MNSQSTFAVLFGLSALVGAQGLYQFEPSSPARASEVNRNFFVLDSISASKASQSDLNEVSIQVLGMRNSLTSKVDLPDFLAFQKKHSRDSLTLASLGNPAATTKQIADTAKAIRSSFPSNVLDMASVAMRISDTASAIRATITPRSIGAVPMVGDSVTISGSLNLERSRVRLARPSLSSPSLNIPCALYTPNKRTIGDVWCYDNSLIFHGVGLASWIGASDIPDKGSKSILFSDDGTEKLAWMTQLGASNTFDFYSYKGISWTKQFQLSTDGNMNLLRGGILQGGVERLNSLGGATFSGLKVDGDVSVSGTITGKVVSMGITASTVADYVFEPGYEPMALQEIESFTKSHKHLPEVPSATEIAKNGLDLTEMNLVLLKKVEELTLHAIAQEKRMVRQEALLEAQAKVIDQLKDQVRTR
ncbi:MAG: hypothetical protein IPN71_12720 [Fibrobacteres bacterium]|nr:hypothetical protein [Fibrobacterota bacterium]